MTTEHLKNDGSLGRNDQYRRMHVWTMLFLLFLSTAFLSYSAFAQKKEQVKQSADIAFIGLHGGIFDSLKKFEKKLNIELEYLKDKMITKKLDLSGYKIVFTQHLRDEKRDIYRGIFKSAKEKNPQLRIIDISGYNMSIFEDLNLMEHDPEIRKYYGSSVENLRRFLIYTLAKYMGRELKILPPEEVRKQGLYHPDHDGLFEDVSAFLRWSRDRGWDIEHAPRVIVAVHGTHLTFQQPKVVDALIREFEKQKILTVAMIDLREPYEEMALEFKPDAVVHTCHSRESVSFRKKLDVPHLHSIFFRKQSIDEWRKSDRGINPSAVAFQVTAQEILGAIEPQVGAGTLLGGGSSEAFTPIPERIEHLVDRTASWIWLRQKPNAEKRVAIIYYDRELGKAELMRGSATGKYMNGPRSLVNALGKMKDAGYTITQVPVDEDELVGWMMERGRQIGVWAPGELDKLVRNYNPVLIPTETYINWFNQKLPETVRKDVIERWGLPPGRFLVWENSEGEKFIVIPRIDLGNVILLPQPLRGEAHDPSRNPHDKKDEPPHNYIATYFWLREEFNADALIHFGTHGTEFMLPGKEVGLSNKDWPDILMGDMPNINPWIINNLGESLPVKRRAYAVIIDHLPPPLVNAGLSDELLNIHNDIDKWKTLESGALRKKFRATITQEVKNANLQKDLHLDLKGNRLLSSEEIRKVSRYLHKIHNETTPVSLHVFGEPPQKDLLIPYLVSCLRKKFLDELGKIVPVPEEEGKFEGDREKYLRKKAEEAVELVIQRGLSPLEAVVAIEGKVDDGLPEGVEKGFKLAVDLNKRFARTHEEVDNLLKALDGRFISPGPGNSPVRNPAAVPTGRNMYMFNPEEVPSRPSWELGKKLVDQLLSKKLKEKGRYPKKVGFTLNSFATFADYGVMESQILYLIGVKPVWNEQNLVVDVKLIPKEELKRPRIDVFIALNSYYRDNLPSRIRLLDKAFRLVAEVKEKGNYVHDNTAKVEARLARKGIPPKRAAKLAAARMFGYPAGAYGDPSYYYLVERSGNWDTREDLMKMYLAQVKNVYSPTEKMWGESAPEAYDALIQGTELVLRSWSRSMTSPLSNKYTWYKGGSLSLAIKHLTGKEPEFYLSDVRDPDNASMVVAEDALRQEYRVRLFNRKWIEGMMKEGYAGADIVAKMVANTMGWKIMREKSVSDDVWEKIVDIYVHDSKNLNIREWFEAENPYAFQEMTEILLETIRKGYWDASEEMRRELARLYAQSIARHGESGGLRGGGNEKLEKFVEEQLKAPGTRELEALLAQYQLKVKESSTPGKGTAPNQPAEKQDTEQVRGKEMEKVEEQPRLLSSISWWVIGIVIVVLFLLILGYRLRGFPGGKSRS